MLNMSLKILTLKIVALVATNASPARSAPTAAAQEVRELLAASRGVAPAMCTLAADGVSSWGGRWYAPAEAVRSTIRSRLNSRGKRRVTADDMRALMEGIASADNC